MKLPLSWLSDYVDITGVSLKEYNAGMTMSGSKVEGIDYLGEEINNVLTGKILSVEPHPDSDHLIICQLDVGKEEPVQIVTGAPNITPETVGCICPVALHKSTLPGGVKITKGKLRGVVSNGMMCSFQELGLDHGCVPYAYDNGILLLPEGTPVGVDAKTVLGLDEHVADFEITSNRPDCLSVIGLARETAATFNRPLTVKEPQVKGCGENVSDVLSVTIEEPELCPRYTAKVVKNIKLAPSPAWMRERLFAAGVRPINNIVDITNYVMLEYGQPMHAFDYACLSDGKIVVRKPKPGESIETLDGQSRAITPEMLTICDGSKPVAIAGVMGGANSEITNETKVVVFESACFHGATVRLTAKALGMRTEASGRFEKGLRPESTLTALLRACELIEELGAGEVLDGVVDADHSDRAPRTLPFEPERINTLLGINLSAQEQAAILGRLAFKVEGGTVTVPAFRTDISRMCDLAEEVARIYGYDNIPTTLYMGEMVIGELTPRQQLERTAASVCRACGFDEAMTHSFISPKAYDQIGLAPDSDLRQSTTILNPLGEDFSVMRTTTLPSMLGVLAHNYAHRNASASLYEMGMVYQPAVESGEVNSAALPAENRVLTFGSYGALSDFFALKGVLEAVLCELNITGVSYQAESENPSYHPGRCAKIFAGETLLGVFGTVHPAVSKNFGFSSDVVAAELYVNALFDAANPSKLYAPLPKFPASTRDIALLVDDSVQAADLAACIRKAAGAILEDVTLFDVYKGKNIPEGQKSMAYSMSLRAGDRTLTDEECDGAMKKAIAAAEKDFGAILRG